MQLFNSVFKSGHDSNTPALIFDDQVYSYERLRNEITRTSDELHKRGVHKGSKVLLSLPSSPGFLISLFAINHLDAIFIPVNSQLKPAEKARILDIARPNFLITPDGDCPLFPGACLSKHSDPIYADDSELAAILFTSGTTGIPKGVMMTDENLLSNARSVIEYLGLTHKDRTLVFLPLHYSYSLSQYLTTFLAGGTVVLMENLLFPAVAFRLIQEHGVTGLGGVPTSLNILARYASTAGAACPSLRYILNAGGPIAPALIRELIGAFPRAHVINNYGCTEIGPRATYVDYSDFPDQVGSIGKPIPGVKLTLIKDDLTPAAPFEMGEIVLQGPSLTQGYYRNSHATREAFSRWGFHTGDYAYADQDGFLFIQGRKDDIFKCAGEKVSAKEIEDVLLEHRAIFEAAVVAQEDPIMGAVPVAYVVMKDQDSEISSLELQTFCAERLARPKIPRAFHFVEELQKGPTGKIQKYRLREAVV